MEITPSKTASSLLLSSQPRHRFSSTCAAIDQLLTPIHPPQELVRVDKPEKAGLGEGAVLELLGPPGVGKTRTAMGFVLAERFRDRGGHVLVVDAEGSLSSALLKETTEVHAAHHGYEPDIVRDILAGIRYRRIDSAWMLFAFFNSLETWLAVHPKVKLIVIDSLSAHFRQTIDSPTRIYMADTIRNVLSTICSANRVSVIITNQMSLKLFGPDNRPTNWSRNAEALLVSTISDQCLPFDVDISRILLYYSEEGERLAHLVSAPMLTQARDAAFTMDLLGPCDYPEPLDEMLDDSPT
ncbi:rad51-like protein [Rhodotorula toruloides]|uniref:Rad51-like protein n=1 Tax=Rhodotorula toruloides TaxID=5286 RepID=A0A511KB32_RHOTO|nr:rad51-like protein [Rhodotorula toruloides]